MSWRHEVIDYVNSHAYKGKRYIRVNCPACLDRVGKPDWNKSISVNLRTGWWKCWRCNWRNRLSGFSDDEDSDDVTDGWVDVEEAPLEPLDFDLITCPTGWSNDHNVQPGVRYAIKRGIHPVVAADAKLGYVSKGKHRNRLAMPIYRNGELVGWQARSLSGAIPKYQTAEGYDRNHNFYGPDKLYDFVVLTEGPVDAISMWPYAQAALGKPSDTQLAVLHRWAYDVPIIVALDGDAWRESDSLATVLKQWGHKSHALWLPPGTDLGVAPRAEIIKACKLAIKTNSTVSLK